MTQAVGEEMPSEFIFRFSQHVANKVTLNSTIYTQGNTL
jgi:hypothetical protein